MPRSTRTVVPAVAPPSGRSIIDDPLRLHFGTDLAPDPQPMLRSSRFVNTGTDGARVIGTVAPVKRDHMATEQARRSVTASIPESAWTADCIMPNGAYREVREDRYGGLHYRLVRTTTMGDLEPVSGPARPGRTPIPAQPHLDLTDEDAVGEFLAMHDVLDVRGTVAFAYGL